MCDKPARASPESPPVPPQILLPIFLPPSSTNALPWIQDLIRHGLEPASSNIKRSQRLPLT